ncbi:MULTISPECIES: ATP-binding protein [unclassified Rhodococcus (in: high G+C Gram-positive bacteria)]|uniref:sensor histidine kinase n=1 Tax=Rhodococcus sp. SJ-3 TaxID=3454628 RepID=UPI003F7942C1
MAFGTVGSILLANRWKTLTLGLETDQLAELVREQEVVLHGISDGVVATDAGGTVTVVNSEARRLLNLHGGAGDPVEEIGMSPRLLDILHDSQSAPVAATAGDRVVVAVARRVIRDRKDLGTVMSVRDRTDVENLTRELGAVQSLTTALRAQRHEFANLLHLLNGLLQRGRTEQAADFIEQIIGSGPLGQHLEGVDALADPYLHAFLTAKAAHARENGVRLVLGENTWVHGVLRVPVDVTTVLGNLLDNAIEAARESRRRPAEVEVELVEDAADLHITVADTGNGVAAGLSDVFEEGATTHTASGVPGGRGMGLALARQIAREHGGDVHLVERGGRRTPDNPTGGAVFLAVLAGVLDEGDTGWADQI